MDGSIDRSTRVPLCWLTCWRKIVLKIMRRPARGRDARSLSRVRGVTLSSSRGSASECGACALAGARRARDGAADEARLSRVMRELSRVRATPWDAGPYGDGYGDGGSPRAYGRAPGAELSLRAARERAKVVLSLSLSLSLSLWGNGSKEGKYLLFFPRPSLWAYRRERRAVRSLSHAASSSSRTHSQNI